MHPTERIYVAGHKGMVGAALVQRLREQGFENLILRTHRELDLTEEASVRRFFHAEKPDHVFLAAAKVGGILANNNYPADFIRENLAIQTHIIHEAWRSGVQRLLLLGSSCIYPRASPQPMAEEYLLTGPLEPTNRPYALAKIAGIEMCWAYNRQHGTQFLAVMPTNLYGPGDNFDLETSHVIPALVRKCHEAKIRGDAQVTVWGSGAPRREFMHSRDAADACVFLMHLPEGRFRSLLAADRNDGPPPIVNIGFGEDLTIAELTSLIADIVGFRGEIVYDRSRPDGTPQKLVDSKRLRALGWHPSIPLRDGLVDLYAYLLKNGYSRRDSYTRV